MAKTDKLIRKLEHGSINARELKTLMRQVGWRLDRTKGSHEIWTRDSKTFVLATHSKDLKMYQIKQAQLLLLLEDRENG